MRPATASAMAAPGRVTGRLPILTFHAVDDADRSAIAFPPAGFGQAIEILHRVNAQPLELAGVADLILGRAPFPSRAVVLTFDDGYQSMYEAAFPILQLHRFTATVFLTVGRGRTGPDDALPSMNGRRMLRWREIRAMHESGISFGAHTLTHPDLTRLPAARARAEIWESKARIEDALGAPVTTFAYPYGSVNGQIRRLVAERFDGACADRLGLASARSDPLALERVDTYYLRAYPAFDMIFTEIFPWYLRARNLPRLMRRRLGNAVTRMVPPSPGDGGGRSVEEAVHGR
jgi:peptidoglycan/xylan/chitin deacetylase (PgdA/CDA1 family)